MLGRDSVPELHPQHLRRAFAKEWPTILFGEIQSVERNRSSLRQELWLGAVQVVPAKKDR